MKKITLTLILLLSFALTNGQNEEKAWGYFNNEQYELAAKEFKGTLKIAETENGKDSKYAVLCLFIAVCYERSNNIEEALSYYIKCNEVYQSIPNGIIEEYYGISLSNLAGLYKRMGQYNKALPLYLAALENTEKSLGKDHSSYGIRLNNLAELYESMGQYNKALPLFLEVLENTEKSFGKDHSEYGIRLNNLAALYWSMGQYNNALPLYLEALKNIEKSLGKDHSSYGISLNNLATLYEIMGQYNKALPLYLEALKITKKSLGKDHSSYSIRLNNLAGLYRTMGQYNKAIPLYQEALKNTKKSLGKDHSEYGNILNNMALLYRTMGQYNKALPLYIEGIENINQNINQNFTFLSENEKELYLKTISYNFKTFNSFALQHKNKFLDISIHVFDNTLTNKGILLKSSTAMRTAILSSSDPALINKFDHWLSINRQIAILYSTEISKRAQDPIELEEQATTIERQLVRGSQEFSNYRNQQNTTWLDVQKRLKPNEAAIEFISFDFYNKDWTDTTYYCALLVKPDSDHPEMITLFTEQKYENIINSSVNSEDANLVAQLYGKKRGFHSLTSNNTYTNYADSLYSLIWSKIDPYLDRVETVYYSPSGLLHNISFAAIPYNDSLLLSDKYELVYVASTGNIVNKTPQKDINEFNITLYGGLNYDIDTNAMLASAVSYNIDNLLAKRSITIIDSTRGGNWNYLHGTLDEAESIESMFENNNISTKMYTANNGIEESFKSLSGRNSPEIIHLATHGFFFPDPKKEMPDDRSLIIGDNQVFKESDNPLIRSGLIMAGANLAWNGETIPEGIDDGILTAYEVSGLDLYNTELVVLSACETGLGDIKGSEGVYGLQRSFKMAGVDNLIMSLWQVPDKETSEFMQLFYQNLLAKQSIGVAFRNAQKGMKEKYDPYYWAAFVLIE